MFRGLPAAAAAAAKRRNHVACNKATLLLQHDDEEEEEEEEEGRNCYSPAQLLPMLPGILRGAHFLPVTRQRRVNVS